MTQFQPTDIYSPSLIVHSVKGRVASTRRRGFVLPMTLLLTAMTCVVSVGFARQSLLAATQAIEAEADLQRRWAIRSCRRMLIENAVDLISEPVAAKEQTSSGRTLRFGTRRWSMVVDVADEDSKLNLNFAKTIAPIAAVASSAQQLVADAGSSLDVRLQLQRAPQNIATNLVLGSLADGKRPPPLFAAVPPTTPLQSWGQVFHLEAMSSGDQAFRETISATTRLTCWGSGRLNFHRASERTLQELCLLARVPMVSTKIVAARAMNHTLSVNELLSQLDLREVPTARLARILVDRSSTYSIALTFSMRQHRSHELHIVRLDQPAANGVSPAVGSENGHDGSAGTDSLQSVARFVW